MNNTLTTTARMPKISSYGNYSPGNYGAHTLEVSIGTLTLYFSYQTVVAFRAEDGLRVRRNDWGPTTGKHLTWIDQGRKKDRLPGDEFERQLGTVLEKHGLAV